MKPPPFAYVRARSVGEALASLTDDRAKLLAGGQSLMPMLNFRLATPEVLVDIDGLRELDQVLVDGDSLLIGALVRHERLARDRAVGDVLPVLARAAQHIGHTAIRNRGTIGGSLAHADPTAELPAVCRALRAQIVCDRADGRRRTVSAADFFQGLYTTALEPSEMITWVRIPLPTSATGYGFAELAPREGDFAWAGACAVVEQADLTAPRTRVVVFGVEPKAREFPWPADGGRSDIRAVAEALASDLEPMDDAEFQREVAGAMIERAVRDAIREEAM